MMDIGTIRAMQRRAARKSQRNHVEPLLVTEGDLSRLESHLVAIPFIGDRLPRGWQRVHARKLYRETGGAVADPWQRGYARGFDGEYGETLFVDSSGWGGENEPALTVDQFYDWVRDHGKGHGFAIVETGQFQVVVGVFKQREAK